MAMQVKNVRVCDMTGDEGADTAAFGIRGVDYEMDLTPQGESAFDKALQEFILGQGARVTGKRATTTTKAKIRVAAGKKAGKMPQAGQAKTVSSGALNASANGAQNGTPSADEVRKWAKKAGVKVSVRGRIGKDAVTAFQAAHTD